MKSFAENPVVRRLVAWLFGGFVLCLMVGNQEGSQNDLGISFHKATATGRLVTFLLVGFAGFLVMTFWPLIRPYIRQPGATTILVAAILAIAGMTLMKWYDPLTAKLSAVSSAVSHSHHAPALVSFYFSPIAWVLFAVGLVLSGAAVATRRAILGYLTVAYGVVVAVIVFIAHHQLDTFAKQGPDHTLGVFATCAGYLVFALAGLVAVQCADTEVADPVAALDRSFSWRPGFPMAAGGVVLGLFAFLQTAWFAPQELNTGFHKTASDFKNLHLNHLSVSWLKWFGVVLVVLGLLAAVAGTVRRQRVVTQIGGAAVVIGALAFVVNVANIASPYLKWLGIALFVVGAVLAVVGSLQRNAPVSWAAAIVGLFGVGFTFLTLDRMSVVGAKVAPKYGAIWNNLGSGGWVACLAFSFITAAGVVAALAAGPAPEAKSAAVSSDQVGGFGLSQAAGAAKGSGISSVVIPLSIAIVLFYPPTLPDNWQDVVVTQIAAYLLLAVGLNVVVGWAGLLDLGYIAFYGIGSYSTAYFTGSLPLKPPSALHFSPLWAIPFAIIACLIAGVLLGAPTLRLRGDYLAIVTLGFGEIVQLVAINNPGNLTGGPIGPRVPHPHFHLGGIRVVWGLDDLPYWYLLLVLLIIVIILFNRLEQSRIGRAWTAIREDEVAARATGVRTTKVKLLAFAIGASTSGVAGVFFGSQVGYFDPTNFTLQNSILIVAYVVFGGMGSLQGALAGAAALTFLPYFLQSQVPLPDSQMWIGALIIIMMIFRPAGLIPARRRQAELHGLDAPASAETQAVPASGAM
jgi:ABC-type branched-subunit amino acid transport system permease subunit